MNHWQNKVRDKIHIDSLRKLMESQVGNQEHKPSGTIHDTINGLWGQFQI